MEFDAVLGVPLDSGNDWHAPFAPFFDLVAPLLWPLWGTEMKGSSRLITRHFWQFWAVGWVYLAPAGGPTPCAVTLATQTITCLAPARCRPLKFRAGQSAASVKTRIMSGSSSSAARSAAA